MTLSQAVTSSGVSQGRCWLAGQEGLVGMPWLELTCRPGIKRGVGLGGGRELPLINGSEDTFENKLKGVG